MYDVLSDKKNVNKCMGRRDHSVIPKAGTAPIDLSHK